MTEGVLFYWFCWIFCVITLFFLEKNKARTFFSFWILISIICSNQYIKIDYYYSVSLTFIILYIGSLVIFSKLSNKIYHFIASFTMMIGYVGLLLFEKNSPIWLIGPRMLLISVITSVLISFLSKNFYSRLAIGLVGMCSGEILYSIILVNYHMPKPIGEFVFLDTVLLTLFILFILKQFQHVKEWIKIVITKYTQPS